MSLLFRCADLGAGAVGGGGVGVGDALRPVPFPVNKPPPPVHIWKAGAAPISPRQYESQYLGGADPEKGTRAAPGLGAIFQG